MAEEAGSRWRADQGQGDDGGIAVGFVMRNVHCVCLLLGFYV
jgi:hypothetical protein